MRNRVVVRDVAGVGHALVRLVLVRNYMGRESGVLCAHVLVCVFSCVCVFVRAL